MNPLSFDIEASKPKIGRTFLERTAGRGRRASGAAAEHDDRDKFSESL